MKENITWHISRTRQKLAKSKFYVFIVFLVTTIALSKNLSDLGCENISLLPWNWDVNHIEQYMYILFTIIALAFFYLFVPQEPSFDPKAALKAKATELISGSKTFDKAKAIYDKLESE